jgi:hypothetical protein
MTAVELGPGVHQLTDEQYFADPVSGGSLTSSGARVLLAPGGPARYRHQRDNGTTVVKREFDLGHAVHALVLGAGPKLIRITGTGASGPDAWLNNYDKAKVARARKVGAVPVRPSDFAAAHAMAAAVKAHPIAAKLFTAGAPEQALIWRDPVTGVMCRAKADWLRADGIVDLKTTESAAPDALSRSVYSWGYYIQAAFYLRGFRLLNLDAVVQREPWFAFVAVEKAAPYLVHVHQLSERAMAYGDRKVSEALEIFRDCTASGRWPGYPENEITDIGLPAWVRTEEWE